MHGVPPPERQMIFAAEDCPIVFQEGSADTGISLDEFTPGGRPEQTPVDQPSTAVLFACITLP